MVLLKELVETAAAGADIGRGGRCPKRADWRALLLPALLSQHLAQEVLYQLTGRPRDVAKLDAMEEVVDRQGKNPCQRDRADTPASAFRC